jgi:hypothetical protein
MSTFETRLGLTPILKRLAFYYFTLGYGTHKIDHPEYDEVEVVELYPWQQNPQNEKGDTDYGAGTQINFYRGGKIIRFIEFSIRFTGGGGEQAVRLL